MRGGRTDRRLDFGQPQAPRKNEYANLRVERTGAEAERFSERFRPIQIKSVGLEKDAIKELT